MENTVWIINIMSNLHQRCNLCKRKYQHVVNGEIKEGIGQLIVKRANDGFNLPFYVTGGSQIRKDYDQYYYKTGQLNGFLKGAKKLLANHIKEYHSEHIATIK